MSTLGRIVLVAAVAVAGLAATMTATSRAQDTREPGPGEALMDAPTWIHDDIDAAYARAKESGKPLLVAFR